MEDPVKGTGGFPWTIMKNRSNFLLSYQHIVKEKKKGGGGFRWDKHILDNISEEWSPPTNVTDKRTFKKKLIWDIVWLTPWISAGHKIFQLISDFNLIRGKIFQDKNQVSNVAS